MNSSMEAAGKKAGSIAPIPPDQLFVSNIRHTDALEQVHGKVVVDIKYDLQVEFKVLKGLALLCVNILVNYPIQNCLVLKGKPLRRYKFKCTGKRQGCTPLVSIPS